MKFWREKVFWYTQLSRTAERQIAKNRVHSEKEVSHEFEIEKTTLNFKKVSVDVSAKYIKLDI